MTCHPTPRRATRHRSRASGHRARDGETKGDPVHSSIGFSVKHMYLNTFRAGSDDFTAHLAVGPDGQATPTGTGQRHGHRRRARGRLRPDADRARARNADRAPPIRARSTLDDSGRLVDPELVGALEALLADLAAVGRTRVAA